MTWGVVWSGGRVLCSSMQKQKPSHTGTDSPLTEQCVELYEPDHGPQLPAMHVFSCVSDLQEAGAFTLLAS